MAGIWPGCGCAGPSSVLVFVVGVGCSGAYLCAAAPVGAGKLVAPGCAD